MRRKAILTTLLLLGFTAVCLLAAESKTLNGEWIWSQSDEDGKIRAVFTPTGDQTWDVSFYFKFNGDDHVYTGTAEGSLTNGPFKGTAQNENKRRTWRFSGTFRDGRFEGEHVELMRNREVETGTLTLWP